MMINHIMYTLKILTDLCFAKQKIKTRNGSVKVVYSVLVVKMYWEKIHKEDCLSINGLQFVKVQERIIEFKNYFRQIPVPFKIYANFECDLKVLESYESYYTKKISRSHSL